jgi:hypothetical protein
MIHLLLAAAVAMASPAKTTAKARPAPPPPVAAPAPTPAEAPEPTPEGVERLFVAHLRPAQVDPTLVGILTDLLTHELSTNETYEVTSARDMESMVAKNAVDQQLGCSDPRCAVDLAKGAAARFLVSGSVGRLGDLYVISLEIMDLTTVQVVRRVHARVQGTDKDLVALMEQAAGKLLTGSGKVHGEVGEAQLTERAQAMAEFESVAEVYEKGAREYLDEKTLVTRIGDQLAKKKAARKPKVKLKKTSAKNPGK